MLRLVIILLIVWVFSGLGIFTIISIVETTLLEIIYSFQNTTECTNLEGNWDQTCLETRKTTNQAVQILKLGLSISGSFVLVKKTYNRIK